MGQKVVCSNRIILTLPKIGIEGGSYGGCMVLGALAFHPNEFKVGVDLFGVANWMRTFKKVFRLIGNLLKKALYDEMGDPYTADSVRLKNISPLNNYQKINKPLIVFQGMNDVRVLPIESKEIVEGVKRITCRWNISLSQRRTWLF